MTTCKQFPDHIAFSKHRGHHYMVEVDDSDPTTNNITCECGLSWRVANDPAGYLGSSEAPEG